MERNYKAFISYRHLPFDLKVAKKLHQTIEHYVVPKDYRIDGDKKIGLVFRDKDELPITSNLTENLTMALDHSEYLIVICSNKTKESIWVLEEVEYFLKTHDRNHILVFLIEGTMDENVPGQLMNLYDEDGNIIEHIEPLAANIVADTEKQSMKLFNVEVLRIIATLIGCPFDALYRREQRYKIRRLAIASSVAAFIALGFIGMLVNRNIQIKKQLTQAQIKDSEANAALSDVYYDQGAYTKAIETALSGLPEKEEAPYERPLVAKAETALTQKVPLYHSDYYDYSGSFQMDTSMKWMQLSPDGKHLAILDMNETLFMWDTETNKLLWSRFVDGAVMGFQFDTKGEKISYNKLYDVFGLDVKTGKELWKIENNSYVLRNDKRYSERRLGYTGKVVELRSMEDGKVLYKHEIKDYPRSELHLDYMAESADGNHIAFISTAYLENDERTNYVVYDWNLKKDQLTKVMDLKHKGLLYMNFVYTPENDLFVLREEIKDNLEAKVYRIKNGNSDVIKTLTLKRDNYNITRMDKAGKIDLDFFYIDYLETKGDTIFIGSRKHLYFIDTTNYEITHLNLPDYITGAHALDDKTVALLCDNGVFTLATKDGLTMKQKNKYMDLKYTINAASICGDTYDNLTLVEQPFGNQDQISVIRWIGENHRIKKFEAKWKDKMDGLVSYITPDGKTVAMVGYRSETGFVGTVINEKKEEKVFQIKPEDDKTLSPSYEDGALVDENRLLIGNLYLDLEKQTVEPVVDIISPTVLNTTDYNNQRVITVINEIGSGKLGIHYAENMKLKGFFEYKPEDKETILPYIKPLNAGANGLVLTYGAVDDETFLYQIFDSETESFKEIKPDFPICKRYEIPYTILTELGEEKPYMAYVNKDSKIAIMNLSEDQKEKEEVVIKDSVGTDIAKLLFVNQDQYLLAFHMSGKVDVYDVESGNKVSDTMCNNTITLFSKNTDYRYYITKDEKRIIVHTKNYMLTNSYALIYDIDSMECVGKISGLEHYYKEENQILSNLNAGTAALYPYYSFEKIRKRAQEIIGCDYSDEE